LKVWADVLCLSAIGEADPLPLRREMYERPKFGNFLGTVGDRGQAAMHDDHIDYLHDGHAHDPHVDHCDDGPVDLA
jgi:hypothetical protein